MKEVTPPWLVVRKREDKNLRLFSVNFEHKGVFETDLSDLTPYQEADWTNYPKGVMWAFGEKGMPVEYGMDLVLFGNIPNGSGLSSSAYPGCVQSGSEW